MKYTIEVEDWELMESIAPVVELLQAWNRIFVRGEEAEESLLRCIKESPLALQDVVMALHWAVEKYRELGHGEPFTEGSWGIVFEIMERTLGDVAAARAEETV